jgi:NADH dehydrogenase FAD-containing subunit
VKEKQRPVIVGAGFAGNNAARDLSAIADTTEIEVINAIDYFLCLSLMPR